MSRVEVEEDEALLRRLLLGGEVEIDIPRAGWPMPGGGRLQVTQVRIRLASADGTGRASRTWSPWSSLRWAPAEPAAPTD